MKNKSSHKKVFATDKDKRRIYVEVTSNRERISPVIANKNKQIEEFVRDFYVKYGDLMSQLAYE